MSIFKTENLSEYFINNRKWQGIPSIDIDAAGTLYAAWYSGGNGEGTDNYVIIHKSTDSGKSFSKPIAVIAPPGDIRAYDPVVFTDSSGNVRFYWAQSLGMYDGVCGVWEVALSHGKFSKPRRLCDGIMMNKPTILKNGKWLLPSSLWSMPPYFKSGETIEPKVKINPGSYVVASDDGGQTFYPLGMAIPDAPSCDEHMIVEKIDGSLWMLIRVDYGIAESFSYDGGKTWTESKPSLLKSPVSRFHIRRMSSGRLLLVNHYGFMGRNNLYALLSEDDGITWPYKLLLDERDNISYPDAAINTNGDMCIIYDRDRNGAGEILTACITESEILEGNISSENSYLKNVVSSRNQYSLT